MEKINGYDKVIAIYGVPRSGTSWLGEILDSVPQINYKFQPLFSYKFKNRILMESTKTEIDQFFNELFHEDTDEFINQKIQREEGKCPKFKHPKSANILAYKETRYLYTVPLLLSIYKDIKIVAIIRNPIDTLESWINAPKEFKEEWDIKEEWLFAQKKNEFRPENYYGYYKWKEWIKMVDVMKRLYPDNFYVIKYEDLNYNPQKIIQELFKNLDIAMNEQTVEFIKMSQENENADAYSVFRNKKHEKNRKYILPDEIKQEISKDLIHFKEAKKWGYE